MISADVLSFTNMILTYSLASVDAVQLRVKAVVLIFDITILEGVVGTAAQYF
jgi:hypothetical protein